MKETKQLDPAFAAIADNDSKEMEIFPGMTVEEIRSLYFDKTALREPAYRVFQLNSDGHRYYYRFNDAGEPEFYPSVTTLLKQVMPTPPALLDWMIANGKDGSVEKRDLAAAYGTFMHIQFETLIINRRYDFDNVPAVLLDYMERENLPEKVFSEWCVKIRKDVLAFAQFARDYNVVPMAVEIGLVHPEFHYAGCVDLPCIMTEPKTGKKFTAIVDFKSGRKGFYEEHELQLHLYREMWNVNYPDVPVERVFNFSPKDWRGPKPTYNLKDQTESVNAKKLPYLLALATIEDEKRENTMTIVRGVLDLDNGKIADNILSLSLAELIKTKATEKDAPEQAGNAPEAEQAPESPKKAVNRTKSAGKGNTPTEPGKAVKTENKEKQLIRAGGAPTPYDVCDKYCREKNCDFCLGEHGDACIEAKARAGYIEPESDRLPWENDLKKGTGIEVEKTSDGVKVTARYFEQAPEPFAELKQAAEKLGEAIEDATKDNLLNDEIEL